MAHGRLALFAELVRNNDVVYNGDFYEGTDFELSQSSGDLSADSVQNFADIFRNSTNGCNANSTYPFPKSWGLILESGSCSIDTKIQLAKSLSSSFLIISSPVDKLKDNASLQSKSLEDGNDVVAYAQYDFPILIMNTDGSQTFQARFVQPLLSNPLNTLKITLLKSDVYASGLYEFTLIAIAILLTISMAASLVMHFHLYRMRRNDAQRQGGDQATLQMQIINQRPPVLSLADLDKYPISIYSKYGSPIASPNAENFKTPPSSPMSFTQISGDNIPIAIDLNLISPILEFSDNCAICIDDFEEGDRLRKLPCKHQFHASCIDTWITEKNASCPLCKLPLISGASPANDSANTSFSAARAETAHISDTSMSSNDTRGEIPEEVQILYDDTDSITPASPDSNILQEIIVIPERVDSHEDDPSRLSSS